MKKFQITEKSEIEEIINNAVVCTMSLIDEGKPYCVPMNYGRNNFV